MFYFLIIVFFITSSILPAPIDLPSLEGLEKCDTTEKQYEWLVQSQNNFFNLLPDQYREAITKLDNVLENFSEDKAKLVSFFKSVSIDVDSSALAKMSTFLESKKVNGNAVEKEVYKNMSLDGFLCRLLYARPLTYYEVDRKYLLLDGNQGEVHVSALSRQFDQCDGSNNEAKEKHMAFAHIGTEKEGLFTLKDLLSQQERVISSNVSVSSETFFINNGDRDNVGKKSEEGTYEKEGMIAGVNGAKMEIIHDMFSSVFLIYEAQNNASNGYGKEAAVDNPQLKFLAQYYNDQEPLPSFQEIKKIRKATDKEIKELRKEAMRRERELSFQKRNANDAEDKQLCEQIIALRQEAYEESLKKQKEYLKLTLQSMVDDNCVRRHLKFYEEGKYGASKTPLYLVIEKYKNYLKSVIMPFLKKSNDCAKGKKKQAYCYVTGIGLGVWRVCKEQELYMLEVYREILDTEDFDSIGEIHFGCFSKECESSWKKVLESNPLSKNQHINYSHSFYKDKNDYNTVNPAEKLKDRDMYLSTMYAWDSNSFPGNEFWQANFNGSGDPAAIASTLAGMIHNILVNPYVQVAAKKRVNDWRLERDQLQHEKNEIAKDSLKPFEERVKGKEEKEEANRKEREVNELVKKERLKKQRRKKEVKLEKDRLKKKNEAIRGSWARLEKEVQAEKDQKAKVEKEEAQRARNILEQQRKEKLKKEADQRARTRRVCITVGFICGFALMCKLLYSFTLFPPFSVYGYYK